MIVISFHFILSIQLRPPSTSHDIPLYLYGHYGFLPSPLLLPRHTLLGWNLGAFGVPDRCVFWLGVLAGIQFIFKRYLA